MFSTSEQGYNCDQGWIQSVALGYRTPFLGSLQGKDDNMCPAVRRSCQPLKWHPGWVQPTVGGCNTTPEVAPSIELWLCCSPVKYQCVLGFVLLCCYYWSYIIETLWLQCFLLLKESMSFGVKLHAAPAKLNAFICRKQNQRTTDFKVKIIVLVCVFFYKVEDVFCLQGHNLHCLGCRHRTKSTAHCFQSWKTELRQLDWYTQLCETLPTCLVYHLRVGMQSQVEWVVLLSLKRLLAVLWHMDNPTRNQSLHSYSGNRWANMFPDGCPYYSGASEAPGDSRARWNWGVVTTEWTGNELLQDKWAATWEMRNRPAKITDRGWMAASTETSFLCIYIYIILP